VQSESDADEEYGDDDEVDDSLPYGLEGVDLPDEGELDTIAEKRRKVQPVMEQIHEIKNEMKSGTLLNLDFHKKARKVFDLTEKLIKDTKFNEKDNDLIERSTRLKEKLQKKIDNKFYFRGAKAGPLYIDMSDENILLLKQTGNLGD